MKQQFSTFLAAGPQRTLCLFLFQDAGPHVRLPPDDPGRIHGPRRRRRLRGQAASTQAERPQQQQQDRRARRAGVGRRRRRRHHRDTAADAGRRGERVGADGGVRRAASSRVGDGAAPAEAGHLRRSQHQGSGDGTEKGR